MQVDGRGGTTKKEVLLSSSTWCGFDQSQSRLALALDHAVPIFIEQLFHFIGDCVPSRYHENGGFMGFLNHRDVTKGLATGSTIGLDCRCGGQDIAGSTGQIVGIKPQFKTFLYRQSCTTSSRGSGGGCRQAYQEGTETEKVDVHHPWRQYTRYPQCGSLAVVSPLFLRQHSFSKEVSERIHVRYASCMTKDARDGSVQKYVYC